MKLIFLGGVQGVGKTTLSEWLLREFTGKIEFVDPGELFRQYYFREKLKTFDEIEDMFVEKILSMPKDVTILIHWHYAVTHMGGFIPQIGFSRLERLVTSENVESVVLISVRVPVDIIRERRRKDFKGKKRELSKESITLEVEKDLEFMGMHASLFMKHLGSRNVSSCVIENIDLDIAKSKLREVCK
ncbi:MAG: AAA family ATPase [Candidatus Vogelbacteria bacterium]|nr:AAA family ATPase [Candidatus Vogelbacteria bacterium]